MIAASAQYGRLRPTNLCDRREPLPSFVRRPRTNRGAVVEHRNSNVSNILPVTTLRTIDLGGKKNSDPLFSRFCGKLSVFFEGICAPKLVHWTLKATFRRG